MSTKTGKKTVTKKNTDDSKKNTDDSKKNTDDSKKIIKTSSPNNKNSANVAKNQVVYKPQSLQKFKFDSSITASKTEGGGANQDNYYIKKGDDMILIQHLSPIELKGYGSGIPKIDDRKDGTIKSDANRQYVIIPLVKGDPEYDAYRKHFEDADKFFGSENFRKKNFPKTWNKMSYSPLIKKVVPPDDKEHLYSQDEHGNYMRESENEKSKGKKYSVYDTVKIRFKMAYESDGTPSTVSTEITRKDIINPVEKLTKDDYTLTVEENKTITDLEANITKGTIIEKHIFYYCKLWVNRAVIQGTDGKKLYGVQPKFLKFIYIPPPEGNGSALNKVNYDEENDDDEEMDGNGKNFDYDEEEENNDEEEENNDEEEENNDEEEENNDDEEEDKPPIPPKKLPKNKTVTPTKKTTPPTKKTTPPTKKTTSPGKKTVSPTKKVTNKSVTIQEDDDDDDTTPTVKKPVKKNIKKVTKK